MKRSVLNRPINVMFSGKMEPRLLYGEYTVTSWRRYDQDCIYKECDGIARSYWPEVRDTASNGAWLSKKYLFAAYSKRVYTAGKVGVL